MPKLDLPRYHRLAKEGSWIIAGQVASMLGALVLVRVLTEYLDPAQYGELTLGLTIAGLVNQVAMGGIAGGIGRYYSIAAEKNDLPGYLNDSLRLMGYAVLGVGVIALALIASLLLSGQSQWIPIAMAALMLSVIGGFNSALSGIQNAARQRAIVALHAGMDAWLKVGLSVAVVLWIGSTSFAVATGYVLSALVVIVSQLFFLGRLIPFGNKAGRQKSGGNWAKDIWGFSWPLSTWGIFTWAQQASDKWALAFYASTDEVGGYAVLFQLGFVPISLGSSLLVSLIAPIMYQRVGDAKDYARVQTVYVVTRNISLIVLAMSLVAAVLVSFWHEAIFHLLANERYHGLSNLMPWLVIAAGFQACHHVLGVRVSSTLKVSSIVVPQIVSAIVFVGLNVLGAFLGGVQGLVYGFVVASFIYFAWMLVLSEMLMRGMPGRLVD